VSPPPSAVELLRDLAPALAALNLRWYVFGAVAVAVHGRPRTTLDVDVTVEVDDRRRAALVDALLAVGFELRITRDVDDFVARTRVIPLVHRATRTPLDVVLSGPGLEELFLERAVEVDLGVTRVPFISAEDLVIAKVMAGRPKDLEDLRGLLADRRGDLDLAHVRRLLHVVEEALGQSDLTPTLEGLLAQPD
jgi:hypothetical protein